MDKKYKKYIIILFAIYIILLLYLTIFASFYHRNTFEISNYFTFLKEYLKDGINLIPFKTIFYYLKNFFNFKSEIYSKDILLNIFGNFVCLIPLAFFIPYFFKKSRSIKKYSIIIILVTLSIEVLQFLTMTGSFDIDDILLNSSGSIIFYLLFSKEIISFIDDKISINKNFIIKLIIIFIIIISIIVLFIIRKKEEYKYFHNVIDFINYKEVCEDNTKTKIYHEGIYDYYLDCSNPEDIEITINNKKYKLLDYLNDKTPFYLDQNKLYEAGIYYTKETTAEYILICDNKGPVVRRVEDNTILEIQQGEYLETGHRCIPFYILPKKNGTTIVTFEYDNKIVEYSITINNLQVTKKELLK